MDGQDWISGLWRSGALLELLKNVSRTAAALYQRRLFPSPLPRRLCARNRHPDCMPAGESIHRREVFRSTPAEERDRGEGQITSGARFFQFSDHLWPSGIDAIHATTLYVCLLVTRDQRSPDRPRERKDAKLTRRDAAAQKEGDFATMRSRGRASVPCVCAPPVA